MRCISPITLRRPHGFDVVPCNKCNFCLQTRRNDWTFRLVQESRKQVYSDFLTLTYTDANLPVGGTLVKDHCILFLKRLRKMLPPKTVRYYLVGEYGTETGRCHYHAIAFGIPQEVDLSLIWTYGHVDRRPVEIGAMHYVTKYHVNRYGDHGGREPPFALMSRRPGIGFNYVASHTNWHRVDFRNYAQVNGIVTRLPRYYKEKIFSESERKALAEISRVSGEVAEFEALEKLRKFHPDVYQYWDERVTREYESIVQKCNTKNLF